MVGRLVLTALSLLSVAAALAQTPAPPAQPQAQCPAVFVKLHEDITHNLVSEENCVVRKASTPDCQAVHNAVRRLIAEREKLCRDHNMPTGVCGCP